MDAYSVIVEITAALHLLGVYGSVEVKPVSQHPQESRWVVSVGGEEFGVYDTERKTFVG